MNLYVYIIYTYHTYNLHTLENGRKSNEWDHSFFFKEKLLRIVTTPADSLPEILQSYIIIPSRGGEAFKFISK